MTEEGVRTSGGSRSGGDGTLKALLFVVLVAYLLLGAGSALTERPGVDEGFFANPAVNLLRRGFMGTTTIETAGTTVESMRRHTY